MEEAEIKTCDIRSYDQINYRLSLESVPRNDRILKAKVSIHTAVKEWIFNVQSIATFSDGF